MWMHIPESLSPSSRSAPGSGCSTSASAWQYRALARSAWWRGKPRRLKLWLSDLRKGRYARLRFGVTLPPSPVTISRVLTSCAPASPVSPFPRPESAWARKTRGGYGPSSTANFAEFDPDSSSWKTCQGSLFEDSTPFSDRWPNSGSMRSGICFERQTSVRRTSGSGSSSSPSAGTAWTTPAASEGDRDAHYQQGGRPLSAMARAWPTGMRPDGKKAQMGLSTVAKQWPTPQSRDYRSPDREGSGNLERKRQAGWTVDLNSAAVEHSPRGPQTTGLALLETSGPLSLNPNFVEWLMGLPPGWTDSVQLATGSFREWWRSHSQCWRNALEWVR